MVLRLFMFILLAGTSFAHAQYTYQPDFQQKFDNLTWNNGLPSNKILDIHQDGYGLIWLATPDGLVCYDGYSLRVYQHNPADSTSIAGSYITSIAGTDKKELWIGTKSGLNRFDYTTGAFAHFKSEAYNPASLRDDYVRAVTLSDSLVWIETVDGTLSRLNRNTHTIKHYKHEPITQEYYDYHALFLDEGKVWIGGRNMGPLAFDIEQETFRYYQANARDTSRKRDNDVACFYKDAKGNFWVSGIDGTYRFWPEKGRFEKFLSSSTFSIQEDHRGNLWMGTGNGAYVYNFDSKILKHYSYSGNNPDGLVGDDVYRILTDRNGTVWLGTNNGLSRLSYFKHKFKHMYHVPDNAYTLSGNQISALMTDKRGNVWVGTDGSGLDVFNKNLLKINTFKENPDDPKALASNNVSALYQDRKGIIWAGLWRGIGFNRYSPKNANFKLYTYSPGSFKNDWYNDFLEDKQGRFWLGFWGASGAMLFDRNREAFTGKHLYNWHQPAFSQINKVAVDHKGRVWMIANKRHLYMYNPQDSSFWQVTGKYTATDRFSQNFYADFNRMEIEGINGFGRVFDLEIDKHGNVWIANPNKVGVINLQQHKINLIKLPEELDAITSIKTGGKSVFLGSEQGVWLYDSTMMAFHEQIFDEGRVDGLFAGINSTWMLRGHSVFRLKGKKLLPIPVAKFPERQVTALMEDRKCVWVGTDHGLYRYFWRIDSMMVYERTSAACTGCISDNYIHAIKRDANGRVWVATDKGLNLYNPETRKFKHYVKKFHPDSLYNSRIFSIATGNSKLWMGSAEGLLAFDKDAQVFSHFNKPGNKGLTSRLTTTMLEDSYGDIWIGTSDNGLNRLIQGQRNIRHYSGRYPANNGFNGINVHALHETADSLLWVGTDSGLFYYNRANDRFAGFAFTESLPSREVKAINSDNRGNLWFALKKHLVHFAGDDTFTVYRASDGIQPGEFSNATTRMHNGKLLFGGEKGLSVVEPDGLALNPHQPQPQITGFKKMRKQLSRFTPRQQTVKLHYKENFFTIQFSALSFSAPGQNTYRYKLNRVDHDWVTAEGIHQASYTDVDPGIYRFEVYASNHDGVWSPEPAVLEVEIIPPFWQTIWFYIIVALAGFSVIGFLIYLRIAKLKSDRNNLALEQRLLISQMNPHFVFNALTSIQNYIMQKETLKASHYLSRFAKLIRFILNHSRQQFVTLDQEVQMLQNFMALQKMRFDHTFDFTIFIDDKLEAEFIRIPPMLVQPFAENAVKHAFRESDKKGMIDIRFFEENNSLVAVISDNGIGIEKGNRNKKSVSVHKSLGMSITKERIQNLKKLLKQPVHIRVNDLSAQADGRTGTEVRITFPLIYDE